MILAVAAAVLVTVADPTVLRIEPSAPEIPANTLRLYVVFDEPARGYIGQHDLHLLDATGRDVGSPFMDFGQELWSPDGRRLTVLFDPGRIKRDVVGTEATAAPLDAGGSYRLVLGDYSQTIQVGPPDRRPLNPAAWSVTPPSDPEGRLAVTFDRVMDAGLLLSQMSVVDSQGNRVPGVAEADPDDRIWRFTPAAPWTRGSYRIVAAPALEDVSGNRVGEALDHAVGTPRAANASGVLPFQVAFATPSCPPQPYWINEDCSGLRGADLAGLDRLRFLPLNPDASRWLSVGGEYRLRIERVDPPGYGVSPRAQTFTARAQRLLIHADVRAQSGWRGFLQLSAAGETGRHPAERSFDRSDPDIQQGFIEVPLAGPWSPSLRLGRQELDLGGSRLVGSRDGPNLRLAFDLARLELRPPHATVAAFWGRPVRNGPDAFDDRAAKDEVFYGAVARTTPVFSGRPGALDLMFLARDRDRAIYANGTGPDRRRALAVRAAGQTGDLAWSAQATWQWGETAGRSARAYGLVATSSYLLPGSWKPRLGFNYGWASGDASPTDGRIGSFDPFYPNTAYFTDAQQNYPVNVAGPQISLALTPSNGLDLSLGLERLDRAETGDGVYGPGGLVLIPTPPIVGSGRGVADLAFAHLTWRATRRVQVDLGYVHGFARSVVTAAGGGDLNYGLIQTSYRF